MANREKTRRQYRFWVLGLLWLPVGIWVLTAMRFMPPTEPGEWLLKTLIQSWSLAPVAPCGLPLALACRWLWRLEFRRTAVFTGISLGMLTVPTAVTAGLLGPLAIAIYTAVLSLPAWIGAWCLARWKHARGTGASG